MHVSKWKKQMFPVCKMHKEAVFNLEKEKKQFFCKNVLEIFV